MNRFDSLAEEFLATQPADEKRPIRRRVLRCVLIELPAYQVDLNNGLTSDDAQEQLKERVLERYKATYQDGPYGFILGISMLVILTTIVLAAIAWAVKRILDKLFPAELQALATEAEAWHGEDE